MRSRNGGPVQVSELGFFLTPASTGNTLDTSMLDPVTPDAPKNPLWRVSRHYPRWIVHGIATADPGQRR